MIRAAPRLKLLHKWGIGVDKFDLDAARAARVPVAITVGANAGAVSEHAVMLMLATYRRLSLADRKLREGHWIRPAAPRRSATSFPARPSASLGFGNVGRMVAHRLAGFEVDDPVHDIRRADMATAAALHATPVPFDELIGAQRRAVDARAAHQCHPGPHRRRGDRADEDRRHPDQCRTRRDCDEAALYDALVSGKLRGAGLDVFASGAGRSRTIRCSRSIRSWSRRTPPAARSIWWPTWRGTPSPTCSRC